MARDWTAAHEKIAGTVCRIPGCGDGNVDPAHVIDRSLVPGPDAMNPGNIVPLCRTHHTAYDEGTLDLLPHLSRYEQATAVALVGLVAAYERITHQKLPRLSRLG